MKNITKKRSGLMYLCGHPGTGKTSSLNLILSQLRKHADKGDVGDFHILMFNAMTFTDAKSFSLSLLQSIQEKMTEKKSVQRLSRNEYDDSEIVSRVRELGDYLVGKNLLQHYTAPVWNEQLLA